MGKNTKNDGRKIINDYIKRMDGLYEEQRKQQEDWLNDMLEDGEWFNYKRSLKFTRTWELLKSMDNYAARNLLMLFNACDSQYKETLESLAGLDVEYKNVATLRVMVHNARKLLKEIYNERYGIEDSDGLY